MNRETFPSALFPLRGDLNAEAGATTVEVIGLQNIPIKANPRTDGTVPTYVAANGDIEWEVPTFNSDNVQFISLVAGDVIVWNGSYWVNAPLPEGGTVISFAAGDLSPLFTTSVATDTTTPSLSFTLSNAAQNSVFAGPASGGAGAPSFRALVALDIPALPYDASGAAALAQSNAESYANSVNTSGTAAGLSGTPSISITNLTVSGTISFAAGSIAAAAIGTGYPYSDLTGAPLGVNTWAALTGDLRETQVIPFDGGIVGTPDTGISRINTGEVAIGDGTMGDYSGSLKLTGLTVTGGVIVGNSVNGVAFYGGTSVDFAVTNAARNADTFLVYDNGVVVTKNNTLDDGSGNATFGAGLTVTGGVLVGNSVNGVVFYGGTSVDFAVTNAARNADTFLVYDNGVVVTKNNTLDNGSGGATFASLTVTGKLLDSTGVAGTSGQILSSTGTATLWKSIVLAATAASTSHKWLNSYTASTGAFTESQPSVADLSDTPAANTVLAGPTSGAAATAAFRALVSADIPANAANTSGSSASCTGNAASATVASGLTGTPSISITNLTVSGTTSFAAGSIALAALGSGTLSQNTSGTSAGLTGTPAITVGAVTAGVVTAKRYNAHAGTALAASDYAASSGWGTSPTKTAVGGTDQGATFTITAKATVSASPTITLTFHDGTWTTVPVIVVSRQDVVAAAAAPGATVTNQWVVTSVSATAVVFTFNGTPVANNTYGLSFIAMGT
jgi:hypothetical protein